MSSDLFESPKLLIGSAPAEIRKLESACQEFVDKCERRCIIKHDPNTREKIIKLRELPLPAGTLRVGAYRIVNDLRNALDQACFAASKSITRVEGRYTNFPFGTSRKQVTGSLTSERGPYRDIPPSLHPFLLALEPYDGGNGLLRGLGAISNPNKHQVMLKTAVNVNGIVFNTVTAEARIGRMKWNFSKTEFELFRVPAGQKGQYQFDVPLVISFSDAPSLGDKPLIATLDEMAGMVDGIVRGLEAETARIIGA